MKSQVAEQSLDGVEIFRDLEEAERARLAAELETLNLRRGDVSPSAPRAARHGYRQETSKVH